MDETEHWIAVVDDDIPNLKIAGTILSENGMRVTALNSGNALIERIKGGIRPDIILLDILMPGMDGFRTYEELRRCEREAGRKEIPVVFLTADDNKDTKEKALALGALALITKPFNGDTLVQQIESLLARGDEPLQFPDNSSSTELLRQELKNQFSPLAEKQNENGALITDRTGFEAVYRFAARYVARYGGNVQKVLVSIAPAAKNLSANEFREAVSEFEHKIGVQLRKSDVILRSSSGTFLLLLPMASDDEINGIMERIIRAWSSDCRLTVSFVSESFGYEREKRPEIDGLDWRYAQMNLQNDRLLTNTVKEFTESMPDRIERLGKDFAAIDEPDALNAYRIEVHSMKSAAATVGLLPLSGTAKMLEGYAREGQLPAIKTLHPLFAEAWQQAYIAVCKAFGFNIRDGNKPAAGRVSPELLEALKTGIDDMDTEAVDGALKKILSFEYDGQTAAALQKLKKAAIEFDDSAFEIIKKLQV